ncbi:MAG: hypothetical protein ACRD3P_05815 [Terriglobales bacterium]
MKSEAGIHIHGYLLNCKAVLCVLAASVLIFPAKAQIVSSESGEHPGPPAHEHSADRMQMPERAFWDFITQHTMSGTDAEPNSTPSEMVMFKKAGWILMFHGEAFLNELQQTGPRGANKFFATNWLMPMAQRKIGVGGTLTFRTMLSLEPATVSSKRYPELFQQGETAYGLPIADGQHPHDFFMEIAAMYDYRVSGHTLLSVYAAPIGDPALGPPAYPHRASASQNPLAPLGHHLQDSTHIADDVITLGITHGFLRLEASGFHGREPDEYRWNIDTGKIDSWSARLTANPGQNWSFQYSVGQLTSPESLFPNENIRRMTASLIYNRPLAKGNWASMALWGRNRSLQDGNVGNGYLLESTLRFLDRNNAWTRIENVDRTNELLAGESPLPPNFSERYFTRVQAYTAGYDRDIAHLSHLSSAIGAQLTWFGVPAALQTTYGSHPIGAVAFLRLRVK